MVTTFNPQPSAAGGFFQLAIACAEIIKMFPVEDYLAKSQMPPPASPKSEFKAVPASATAPKVEEPVAACRPCTAFRDVSHITGLVSQASKVCDPERGLPRGVGGTINLAQKEIDKVVAGLKAEEEYTETVATLRMLRPKLGHIGTCDEAASAAVLAEQALSDAHQDTRNHFLKQIGA